MFLCHNCGHHTDLVTTTHLYIYSYSPSNNSPSPHGSHIKKFMTKLPLTDHEMKARRGSLVPCRQRGIMDRKPVIKT